MASALSRVAGAPRSISAAVAALTLALAMALAPPAVARAGWSRPFQLAPPGTLDVQAPRLAISPTGSAAAAFGIGDVDTPGSFGAYLTLRSSRRRVAPPAAVPGAAETLALAYDGRYLELLIGSHSAGMTCCSGARAIRVGPGGRLERPRTLVRGLAGATTGRLLTLGDGGMVAAIATARGVWVVQSRHGNRFARTHRLTRARQMPESLAAAWLGGDGSIVAWTAARGGAGDSAPGSVSYALGSRTRAPAAPRTAVRVAAGHRIDELGVAPSATGETVAWIESWYDARGGYHSVVRASDIGRGARARTLSPAGRLASGLTFAGDPAGDQSLSWEACTPSAACVVQAATRRARGSFGRRHTLGPVDLSQAPSLAIGPDGETVVGWVRGGSPFAALDRRPGGGFGSRARLSPTPYAYDVRVAAGPRHRSLVAWTQGTLNPSVVAAER
ncbi:MAG: hypothetical protein ACRDLV_04640 [Solirubrobacteraceae bacterium]